MARRKFDAVNSVGVFDNQLAAVVFVGCVEEESSREIGANSLGRARDLTYRVVYVRPKRLARLVAIE